MRSNVLLQQQQHEAEERATLEAVLSFLDSCDDASVRNNDVTLGDHIAFDLDTSDELLGWLSVSDHSSNSDNSRKDARKCGSTGTQNPRKQLVATRKRAVKKCKAAAVPPFRRQPKLEILELREQVGQLTSRLGNLQKLQELRSATTTDLLNVGADADNHASVARGVCVPRSLVHGSSAELHYAEAEHKRLQDAQVLNTKLRAAWRWQIALGRMLENAFKKQMTTQDLDARLDAKSKSFSLKQQQAVEREDTVVRDVVLLFAKLHFCMEVLYHQAASSCASISAQDFLHVLNTGPTPQETAFGQTFEFTTSTPLKCSLKELENRIWSTFGHTMDTSSNPYLVTMDFHVPTTTSFENQYTQQFDSQFGSAQVESVAVLRKFQEEHRVVIAFTTMGTLVGTDFKFRETGWLILVDQRETESCLNKDTLTQPRTLLQTQYQAYPENAFSAGSGNAKLQSFILKVHCELMRSYHLQFQSTFLTTFS